jgi:competence protein ComEC
MRSRPLLPIAVAFVLGACVDSLVTVPLWGPLAAGALLLALPTRRERVTILVLFGILGFARHQVARPRDLPGGDRSFVRATGVIGGPVHLGDRKIPLGPTERRTRFDLDTFILEGMGARFPCRRRLRVTVPEDVEGIRYGDRVEVRGWMRGDPPALWARDRDAVLLLARGEGSLPGMCLHPIRERVLHRIGERLSPPAASLLGCMLLGERGAVPPEMRDLFRESGTVHFLAISGLHVALICSFLWIPARLLRVPPSLATAGIILFLVGYAYLVGLRPSVIRASLMIGIYLLGEALGRPRDPLHSLAVSALVLLAWRPLEIHSTGFHLSYLSVLSILTFRETFLLRAGGRIRRGCQEMVAVTASAWIGTAPLVLYRFHLVTPGVIVSNLLVFPLIWITLAAGSLLALGLPTEGIVEGSTWLLLGLLRILSALPGSHLYLPFTAGMMGTAYGIVLAGALRRWLPHPLTFSRLAMAGALLLIIQGILLVYPRGESMRITFLDVGAGGACILELPHGNTMLFDCGSEGGIDPGAFIVAPTLWDAGITRIDALVLSHSHRDHLSGLPSILRRFRVGRIIVPEGMDLEETGGVPVRRARRGDAIEGLGGVEVEVLGPPVDPPSPSGANDHSLVIRIRWMGRSILLTGDIEERGSRWLLAGHPDLEAEILTVPHHGASNPMSEALARAVRPVIAVISAEEGMPDPGTVAAYAAAGARVVSTGDHGTIRILATPQGFTTVLIGT